MVALAGAVEAYLSTLLLGSSVEVRRMPGRGRGLFATQFPQGEPPVVLADGPLGGVVQSAFGAKRGLACSLCGHALGSPTRHLRKLLESSGLEDEMLSPVRGDSVLDDPLSEVITGKPFFSIKKPVFCSLICRDEHERLFGQLRARKEGVAAVRSFVKHARRCNCPFYLLAFKLICWTIAEAKRKTPDEAAAPLRALYFRPYWDAVDAPIDVTEAQIFRARLREDTERSRVLMVKALRVALPFSAGWDFLELAGYSNLIGALCCNAIAVMYVSPVVQHILQVDAMVDCAERRKAVAALAPWICVLQQAPVAPVDSDGDDDEDKVLKAGDEKHIEWQAEGQALSFSTGLFPPFRGYAIYPRLALINHSCMPSCALEFTFSGALFILAQGKHNGSAAIVPGSELSISYLDASLGSSASAGGHDSHVAREQRKRALQSYGFECDCPACCASDGVSTGTVNCSRQRTAKRKRKRSS